MRGHKIQIPQKSNAGVSNLFLASTLTLLSTPALAITAAEVRSKMNQDERSSFIAGIVDGLAQARWIKDKPDATGMRCIYDWHYKPTRKSVNSRETLMDRHPEKPISSLIFALVKKQCGW